MTFEDAKVIGIGSVLLLSLFITTALIRAHGSLNIWAIVRRYVVVKIADMSSIESDDIGIEPPVPEAVSPALEAEYTGTSVPVREIRSRADALDTLARARVDGKYIFTANKLADLFTGTALAASRNIILEEIAAIRNPEKPAPAATHGAPLRRPAKGW